MVAEGMAGEANLSASTFRATANELTFVDSRAQ